MKLKDEEFAMILDLARRHAYKLFTVGGDEEMFDVWMWLKDLEAEHIRELKEKKGKAGDKEGGGYAKEKND